MRVSVTRFTTSTARHGVQRAVCVPSMSLRKAASSLAGPISQRLGFGAANPLFSSPACSTSVTRRVSTTVFAMSEGRQEGTVKWFNATKGFGFIVPSDGGADIFVHQTSIQADGFRSLAEGETVEFEIGSDNNGRPRAINVTGPAGAQPVGAPRQSFAGGPGGGGGRGGRDDYGGGYDQGY